MRLFSITVGLFFAGVCSLSAQTYAPHLFAKGPQFVAGLIQASDGNFYGVTADSMVQVTPAATIKTLHQFSGSGDTIQTGLVEGRDGWLYGATASGLYRISLTGEFQSLAPFPVPNALALSAPVPASDGNFYVPVEGNSLSPGNVYRYNPTQNTLTAIGPETATVGVLQGPDGYLYVTTNSAGIYCVRLDGTGLENFAGTGTGTGPESGITEGPEGTAYGVTAYGGTMGDGVLFEVQADGASSTLFDFDEGFSEPSTALYLASDGTYFGFGSAYVNGTSGEPAMFRFNPAANTLQTVVTDPFIAGGAPFFGPLIGGSDGKLYGTVEFSGSQGAVYTIMPDPPLPPAVQVSAPATIMAGQNATATFRVLNAFSLTMQQCNAFATLAGQPAMALGPVHGVMNGNVYSGSFQGSVPVSGDYTLAVNCGGVESGFANITVEASN
jgi:hypothetical protein